jgi:nucleotide-binding universal stress UspA family protein
MVDAALVLCVISRSDRRSRPDATTPARSDTVDKDHSKEEAMTTKKPILFATDGSPSAAEAQREAIELAQALHAPLVLVSVAHAALPPIGYSSYGYSNVIAELTEAEHKRMKELLDSVAETAETAGVTCSTVVGDGIIVEEICRRASDYDAQLIVVGSHGWGAARRLFSGSVSTGLVHSAPCPVLVVRSAEHALEHAAAA